MGLCITCERLRITLLTRILLDIVRIIGLGVSTTTGVYTDWTIGCCGCWTRTERIGGTPGFTTGCTYNNISIFNNHSCFTILTKPVGCCGVYKVPSDIVDGLGITGDPIVINLASPLELDRRSKQIF